MTDILLLLIVPSVVTLAIRSRGSARLAEGG
jgi:hypothetical protein